MFSTSTSFWRCQCSRKTFMIHQTFVRLALYILFKFVKSFIRHLGLAIGNVRCVRWFSWTLRCLSATIHPWLSVRLQCLVHPGVRDKRRVSEIDLSQPRHETAFWWRHNRPVTSQLTDPITLPNYPLELIGIYVHINTQNKESLTQRCRRSTNVQLCLIFLYISIWFES